MLEALEAAQTCFRHTGGTHAAALFDQRHRLALLREDVGRHNALDKVIGAATDEALHAASALVMTSRASFELVHKAVMARVPVLVTVGAASSLAVEAAERFGLTLIAFARDDRFNVYAGAERVAFSESAGRRARTPAPVEPGSRPPMEARG